MALPKYTEPHYRIWHYFYLFVCGCVFFFLIAPLFVIFPLSFNAEEFLVFTDGMKRLDPDAFSTRWYKDMVYGTKNPWGLAAKNSFIIAIFATIGSIILGTLAALGLSSRHQNIGILITDHNVHETLAITDRAYLMFEGKILMEGSADKLANDEKARKLYLGETFTLERYVKT